MKEIKLTQGKVALVDDEDFEYLNKWKWHAGKGRNTYYARVKNVKESFSMHGKILKPMKGLYIDHRDGNGLNNQKHNLRICTNSQNLCNQKKRTGNISGFKGVSYFNYKNNNRKKKWRARIMINFREITIGYYSTPKEAALAYNNAALKYFGEFARINLINDSN